MIKYLCGFIVGVFCGVMGVIVLTYFAEVFDGIITYGMKKAARR